MRWIFKRSKGHIGLETLSEHLDGRLAATEGQTVERHLESCLQCREEFESLQYTIGLLNRVPEVSPRRVFTLDIAPEPAPVPIARGFRVPAWSYGAAASVAVMLFVAVLSADLTGSLEGELRVLDDSTLAATAPSGTTKEAGNAITPPEPGPTGEAALEPSGEDQGVVEAAESQDQAVKALPSEGASQGAAAGPTPTPESAALAPSGEEPVTPLAAPPPAEQTTPPKAFGDFSGRQDGTPIPLTAAGITADNDAAAEAESVEAAPLEPTQAPLPLTTPASAPTPRPVVTQEYTVETAIKAGSDAEGDETARATEALSEEVAAISPQSIGGSTATFWRVLEGVSAGVAVLLLGLLFLRVLAARRRSIS